LADTRRTGARLCFAYGAREPGYRRGCADTPGFIVCDVSKNMPQNLEMNKKVTK
jgi:hypothetical protein